MTYDGLKRTHRMMWSIVTLLQLLLSGSRTSSELQDQRGIDHGQSRFKSERPVTVADAITMTKLGDPYYWLGGSSRGLVAQFSPDGKKFVVVLRKGNLENNTNEFSMLLWQTAEVFRSPVPDDLLTMSSSSNRPAIRDVKWLPESETVVFLGENIGEQTHLCSFNTKTRALKALSRNVTNLLGYSQASKSGQIAYLAEGQFESLWSEKANRQGVRISSQPLHKLIVGENGTDWGRETQLFLQSASGESHRIYTSDKIEYGNGTNNPVLSPDGKYIVLLLNTSEFPNSWKGYSDSALQKAMSETLHPGQTTWVSRYELIDTSTGKGRALLNVPEESWNTEAVWSPDSHSVVIANTYLPLDNINSDELRKRKSQKFTVEVRVPTGAITSISQGDLKLLTWDAKTNRLAFEAGRRNQTAEPIPKVVFRKMGETWEKIEDDTSEAGRPEIVLDENMNTPPKLFALDRSTQRRALLLDLNPWFKELKFSKVEEISWRSLDEIEVKGGLYYPVDYIPGKRYPLVIQTHAWTPDRFWIDGPWTTAFAAQPLAGKGIMVLQADKWFVKDTWWDEVMGTPKEVEGEVMTYDRAIRYLDEKGLIDPNRVGIIGFSRTCMYVKYALIRSKYHFAAASVTDGIDAGFFQYMISSNANPRIAWEYEGLNGGKPFGEGLRRWMERSPGFNVDKVRVPLRITALNPASALFEWEWYVALSRLEKPVEMVMMQDADHILQKPWERMISQQGNVDWFVFWLKGEEDPDPAKTEEYTRWRELHKLQEESERKSVAPAN
jgi:dipeptidyl aminopeptidase/acylaminoacyl peptidase